MKKKTLNLDGLCFDFLGSYDGRRDEHGQQEMARCGLALTSALVESTSEDFVCELARLVRNGDSSAALDALHSRLMDRAETGSDGRDGGGPGGPSGGDSAPSDSGSLGDAADGGGGSLPPIPRVASGEGVEGTPEASQQPSEGDPESERGPDSREEDQDSDRERGLGNGLISKALGLNE